jgi:hypothetical protein
METLASSTSLDLNLQRTRMQVQTAAAAPTHALPHLLLLLIIRRIVGGRPEPSRRSRHRPAVLRSATRAFIRYADICSECERLLHAANSTTVPRLAPSPPLPASMRASLLFAT